MKFCQPKWIYWIAVAMLTVSRLIWLLKFAPDTLWPEVIFLVLSSIALQRLYVDRQGRARASVIGVSATCLVAAMISFACMFSTKNPDRVEGFGFFAMEVGIPEMLIGAFGFLSLKYID